MATIRPFRAVRPACGLEPEIASLPYDTFNRSEAKEYIKKHNKTFLKIDMAEALFPDDVDNYDEKVYLKAKEIYNEKLSDKEFVKDDKFCFYLYEQTMNGRAQTGLVCCASVTDYENNIILKHENTRAEKEKDRITHVDTLNAQTGPIFLAYREDKSLNDLYKRIKENKPYTEFSNNDVLQRCWIIDKEEDIRFITDTFANIPNLYIADGHHRCAAACKVSKMRREAAGKYDPDKEYNYFLSVIFSDSELMIMDYNRVVKDLNDLSDDEFLDKISSSFNIREIPISDNKPCKKGQIYMFLSDKEYEICLKDEFLSKDPIKSLDVSVLQDHLLKPVLKIDDPKTNPRIDFVGGIRGVKELRKRMAEDAAVAFSMYPTSMNELFNVADAGLLMPPKSTWFEPKLLSGLFIHELD